MKRILLFLGICMVFFGAFSFSMMGDEPERGRVDMPEAAVKLLPDNGDILMSVNADLNGDGKDDYLVAYEYLNAERELIVITAVDKGYAVAARSKRVILCKECGGIYGDPFVRIWADKKKFGVDHFGGSNFKWSNNSTFGYSRRDKKWQLVSFDSANYDLDNNVEDEHYKPADFGLINLEDFDINRYMSDGKIEPAPDETKAAIHEQQTADAVASYTPTPVPAYFYKKPGQLKNRDMIKMPAGTFIQSDGNTSFSHTLSSYMIGKIPVTYELWYVVRLAAEKKGYKFELPGLERDYGQNELPTKDSANPALGMTRRDAIVWCNAYSEQAGLKPVYYSDAKFKNLIKSSVNGDFSTHEDKQKGGFDDPYVDWGANGYRLPTEGEWLYAVSYIDGKTWAAPDAKGNTLNKLGIVYYPNSISEYLYDKFGDYPATGQKDYRGPDKEGGPNVMHSGLVELSPVNPNTRVAGIGERIPVYQMVATIRIGFRVARSR